MKFLVKNRLNTSLFYSSIDFKILAGFPATMTFSGTSFVTTDPAAIIELSPILTPGKMTQLPPIQKSFPIVIGIPYPSLLRRFGAIL